MGDMIKQVSDTTFEQDVLKSANPVLVDVGPWVRNNIYVYGIRGEGKSAVRRAVALMAQRKFDATLVHTHSFPLSELPTALRYARERVEDAIKVVVTAR